ncbi:MAG: chromate transporter, partial [Chloroflexi bacterium]|nr:chromate transporter [Chloroflexota bacterium]
MRRISEVLLTAGWLGLTSFGGPVAHIGYFREAYVVRKRWLDEETFAGLVALCQFLPGPVSSQLGIAIGIRRAGLLGGFAAWFAFTLPSAAALILFSYGVQSLGDQTDAGWLHGLKVVAVAVVALALWGMARTLAPDKPRITIAAVAAIALLAAPGIAAQLAVIAGGGLLGLALLRADDSSPAQVDAQRGTPWLAVVALLAFVALLVALPVAARVVDSGALAVADS